MAVVTHVLNKRKDRVTIDNSIAETAIKVMNETLANTTEPLNKRIDQLEEERDKLRVEFEQKIAALKEEYEARISDLEEDKKELHEAVEQWNERSIKLQLVFFILAGQLDKAEIKPLIRFKNMEDLDKLDVNRLKNLAVGAVKI